MARGVAILFAALTIAWPMPAGASQMDWGRLDSLATGRTIAGPAGWLNWCMAEMARCAPTWPVEPVAATSRTLALLDTVQAQVNAALTPQAEPPGRDLWQTTAASGDCEDYALAKQDRLRAAGLPAGAARLATARLPDGQLHAVLTVETDHGTLVLDNLQPRVVPLKSLGYAWLRAQGFDGSLRWRELDTELVPNPAHARWSALGRDHARSAGTGGVDQ